MKTLKIPVALLLVVMPWLMSRDVSAADVSVGVEISSVDDFYQPLATEGYWVDVGSYGRCWHPSYVAAYWRPYCDGEWVWTDDGWYWQSDEPWGWATYHYGRWTLDPYYGWVWVPDTVWGPSWVCFREGGGYCGWAPLPPGARFGGRSEITIGVGLVPDNWFVCVSERHFGDRHRFRDVIINNTKIINRTVINTQIRREGGRVMTEGPRFENLQRINHEQIKKSNVSELIQHERIPPSIRNRTAPRELTVPRQNERQMQQKNQRQIEQPRKEIPQRERPQNQNKAPEIIRGTPSAPPPQSPPVEKQQLRQPPVDRREPPPEQKQRIEQRPNVQPPPPEQRQRIEQRPNPQPPSGQPRGEKVAPPQRQGPPPQEDGRQRNDRGGDGGDGGRGR
jgi:Family of unknown function (DUF6600)